MVARGIVRLLLNVVGVVDVVICCSSLASNIRRNGDDGCDENRETEKEIGPQIDGGINNENEVRGRGKIAR